MVETIKFLPRLDMLIRFHIILGYNYGKNNGFHLTLTHILLLAKYTRSAQTLAILFVIKKRATP